MRKKCTPDPLPIPRSEIRDELTEVLRRGAQRMLVDAIEAEVDEYVEERAHLRDEKRQRLVVRNGHQPEREILSPIGRLQVRRPRVDDRRFDEEGNRIRFTSAILPPYLRKTKNLEELVPWLYLKGISTGAFPEALGALLGAS